MLKEITIQRLRDELKGLGNKEKALFIAGYFKTGKGEYGEGDIVIGLTVPVMRKIAKKYLSLPLTAVTKLLKSKIHEERFVALEMMVMKYEKGDAVEKKSVVDAYVNNLETVNNWDLVDTSAPYILGDYLLTSPRKILYTLAKSDNLWERRVAIVATYTFIKAGDFADTLAIAQLLLSDSHDLIHKATGWMLREVGNKSQPALKAFLQKHYKTMPRTMLRYAIEKFPPDVRKK
ncbi:MAG: DNA alkylation repair protein, partial [Candidatus Andersenbacteria bacterium]|nr:DNA alkylation repair protein [Candidatus Andersenbacteria bacterium]